MKKIILTLAIAISTFNAFAEEVKVAPVVLDAFKSEFTNAKEVEWTAGSNYFMANFTFNGKFIYAYYSPEGDLLGLSRYISTDVLPMNLQKSLRNNFSEYWVSDLFEVAKNGRTDYFITLEEADKKIILQSTNGTDWSVYKKIRKA